MASLIYRVPAAAGGARAHRGRVRVVQRTGRWMRQHLAWATRLDRRAFGVDAWTSAQLAALFTSATVIVALDPDAPRGTPPLGYLALVDHGNTLEAVNLVVAARARGCGIGAELMAEAQRIGAARRIPLYLDVRLDNAPARRLYAALGFHEAWRRAHVYAPDGHRSRTQITLRWIPFYKPRR